MKNIFLSVQVLHQKQQRGDGSVFSVTTEARDDKEEKVLVFGVMEDRGKYWYCRPWDWGGRGKTYCARQISK